MGFAASKLPTLDWDFNPYLDAAGRVPEPSRDDVVRFNHRLGNALREAGHEIEDTTSMVELARVYATLDEEQTRALSHQSMKFVADVCGGSPTFDQLMAAGHRTSQGFMGWLIGELQDPKMSSATRP